MKTTNSERIARLVRTARAARDKWLLMHRSTDLDLDLAMKELALALVFFDDVPVLKEEAP